jgi:hypothetical protein
MCVCMDEKIPISIIHPFSQVVVAKPRQAKPRGRRRARDRWIGNGGLLGLAEVGWGTGAGRREGVGRVGGSG